MYDVPPARARYVRVCPPSSARESPRARAAGVPVPPVPLCLSRSDRDERMLNPKVDPPPRRNRHSCVYVPSMGPGTAGWTTGR